MPESMYDKYQRYLDRVDEQDNECNAEVLSYEEFYDNWTSWNYNYD